MGKFTKEQIPALRQHVKALRAGSVSLEVSSR